MNKPVYKWVALCLLALSFSAFAQSSGGEMKHDDAMKQGNMGSDATKKDTAKKDKKSKKAKQDKMKKDEMKNDNMKNDDMKKN